MLHSHRRTPFLYIKSTNNWVLPLTFYTQQTLYHKKTVSPPHLEIDSLLNSGAMLNVLKNDTWNEFKEYHKLQLKASTFVLSAANNSKLQSNGTIKRTFYPDVTENRTRRNNSFILTFTYQTQNSTY